MLSDLGVNLLSDAIVILFAVLVWNRYKAYRFGGWSVVIRQGGKEIARRAVSARKMEQILDESSDMSVFVKGVVSPYGWLNTDVLNLISIINSLKIVEVDLDKNPSSGDKKKS